MTPIASSEPILARKQLQYLAEGLVGGIDVESDYGLLGLTLTGPRGSGVSTALRQIIDDVRGAGADIYRLRPEDLVSTEAMSRALQRQGPFRAQRIRAAGLPPEDHQSTFADRIFAAAARVLSGEPQPPAKHLTDAEVDALPPVWPICDEYDPAPLRRVQEAAKFGVLFVVDDAHRIGDLVDRMFGSTAGSVITAFDEEPKRRIARLQRSALLMGGDGAIADLIAFDMDERHWCHHAIEPMERAETCELVATHIRAAADVAPIAETAAATWAAPLAELTGDYPQFAADAGRAAADYLRAHTALDALGESNLTAVIKDFERRRDAFHATVLRDAAEPPSDRAVVESVRAQLRESDNQLDREDLRIEGQRLRRGRGWRDEKEEEKQARQTQAAIMRRLRHSGLLEDLSCFGRIHLRRDRHVYAYHAPVPGILDAPWPDDA